MTTPPKPLAYSYRRFSHIQQDAKSSLKRQLDIAVEYCKKHDFQLVADAEYNFLDTAKSAFHGKNVDDNGELRRFYDLVKANAIPKGSYLIVESLDRLSRQEPKEALPRFLDLLNAGINVVSINDDRVYTGKVSDLDLIVSIMEMSRAHSESSNKSKRVGAKWRDKQEDARALKPMGATKPAWLDAVYRDEDKDDAKRKPTHYVINEAKAEIVRSIFTMAIAGHGREVIARKLNEAGIEAFKVKTWGGSSVAQILKSPTVLGIYQPFKGKGKNRVAMGEPIKGLYEPIIDESTFHRANGAVTARFRGRVTRQTEWVNMWQKIAKCALCGAALHVANKGQPARKYFQCREARKGSCDAKAVRLDRSEAVFRQLLAKVDSLSLVQSNSHTLNAQLQEVEGRIAAQEAALAEHMDFLRTRPSASLRLLVVECEDEITKLQARRVELENALSSDIMDNTEDFFNRLDLESADGRVRANGLLQRLKVVVYFDPANHHYKIERDGVRIFDVLDRPIHGIQFFPATPALSATIQRQDGKFMPTLAIDPDYIQPDDAADWTTHPEALKRPTARKRRIAKG
jgi:DNA invertase Pin-like site-specific DNA recombinase